LVEFLGSFKYTIISSANKEIWTASFHISVTFMSYFCVNAPSRNAKIILNKIKESGHPCLIPDFSGNCFRCSPSSMMLAIGLSYIAFNMMRNIPSKSSLFRALWSMGAEFSQSPFPNLLGWSCNFPHFLFTCGLIFSVVSFVFEIYFYSFVIWYYIGFYFNFLKFINACFVP
jgi:hypothetical protein